MIVIYGLDYMETNDEKIAQSWLLILDELTKSPFTEINPRNIAYINVFLKHFLHLFTQESFAPSKEQMLRFIDFNSSISNLVAISKFGNTDSFIKTLVNQPQNVGKVLALYSARNHLHISPKYLFDVDAVLASRWYFAYLEGYNWGSISESHLARLREVALYHDARLVLSRPSKHSANAYFGWTYLDIQHDYALREQIHTLYREWLPNRRSIFNKPDNRSIGVFTGKWIPTHVVYRALQPFLQKLAEDYKLTLIHLGKEHPDVDRGLFKDVRNFDLSIEPCDLNVVNPNDFGVALFPDIGMNMESIFLSSLRIAPIQVTCSGHPDSTWGSEIDYFINGVDTELPALAKQNYSERLVLIPGCGQISMRPRYEPKGDVPDNGVLRVACCWSSQKINHAHLQRLRKACEGIERPLKFVFFPHTATLGNGFLPVLKGLEDVLGKERVEINPSLRYDKYMELIEGCHFAVDAYPFGGFSTAVDLLWLGKPLVALRGERSYNRAAAYLLNRVGLEELVADSPDQFVLLLRRMLEDDGFRNAVSVRAREADKEHALFSTENAVYFSKAITYLIEHHEELSNDQNRTPILIQP